MIIPANRISSALRKSQIASFLGLPDSSSEDKAWFVEQLRSTLEINPAAVDRLLAMFPRELAAGPTEVEQMLGCTPVERRRWLSVGKLPVLEYRTLHGGHREIQYAVHDRRAIAAITQEQITQWRQEDQEQATTHRRAASQVALAHKRLTAQQRQDFLDSWLHTVAEWTHRGSSQLALVLQLCYWTVWVVRWANENHLSYLRSTRHMDIYAARRDAWRLRKIEATRLLVTTPYARLSFHRPIDADKRSLFFCEAHKAQKRAEAYIDDWSFFTSHLTAIRRCPRCVIQEEKDHFAFYLIEITAPEIPHLYASFHVSYTVGKSWLPAPHLLPDAARPEPDAFFTAGRPLLECEKIVQREKDVLAHFERTLAEACRCFGQNGVLQIQHSHE